MTVYDAAKVAVEALAKAIAHAKHPHGMIFKATLAAVAASGTNRRRCRYIPAALRQRLPYHMS